MREFKSLADFAAFLAEIRVAEGERVALETGAAMIRDEAKRVLGTYEYGWTPLAESTKADRLAKGFAEDEPGLRTGDMRDSIGYTIINDHEAEIGSNEDNMVYFELGTVTQPARPTLAGAAEHKGQDVADTAGLIMASALAGLPIAEILRLATEAAKGVARSARELAEPIDDDTGRAR